MQKKSNLHIAFFTVFAPVVSASGGVTMPTHYAQAQNRSFI